MSRKEVNEHWSWRKVVEIRWESGGKEVGGHGNQVLGLLSDVALCTDSKNEYVHLVGLLY